MKRFGVAAGSSRPEPGQVERELAVMLNGKEDEFRSSKEVEEKVVVHHKLPEIILFFHLSLEFSDEGLRLPGMGRKFGERVTGPWIAAQQRNNVVKEPVEKMVEGV